MSTASRSKPEQTPPTALQRQLPNALTVSRLALAAGFFAVLTPWRYADSPLVKGHSPDWRLLLAAGLFIAAAVTDALDGHLARKWNVISVFGRVMDPFADKVLVLGAFVYLAGPGFQGPERPMSGVAPWMAVVILARELLVTSIRAVAESKGIPFPATASGKWKMILQSVCVPLVLVLLNVAPAIDAAWPLAAIRATVWATVIVTAWSGIPYITRGMAAMRTNPPVPKPPSAPADKPL